MLEQDGQLWNQQDPPQLWARSLGKAWRRARATLSFVEGQLAEFQRNGPLQGLQPQIEITGMNNLFVASAEQQLIILINPMARPFGPPAQASPTQAMEGGWRHTMTERILPLVVRLLPG